MKKKYIRYLTVVFIALGVFYFGYQWEKSRKLDDYFADQISLDWQLQVLEGDQSHHGSLFEEACKEMKELGYSPYEIQQVIFKGYEKADKKIAEQDKALGSHIAMDENEQENLYGEVDFSSFKAETSQVKEVEMSLFDFGDLTGVCITFAKSRYTAMIEFKTKPVIKRGRVTGGTFLPEEPIASALVIDHETGKNFKFNVGSFNQTQQNWDYCAVSEESDAMIDIFTTVDGQITQIDFCYELKKGGMEEFLKFARLYQANVGASS